MHPDDLSRVGQGWIDDRRRREGLEPEPRVAPRKAEPIPLPRLVAVPAKNTRAQKGRVRAPRAVNPFSPFRETAAAIG